MRSLDCSRMRVGYVLPWQTLGGGEIVMLRMAEAMARTAAVRPLAFCYGSNSSDVADAFREQRVEVRRYHVGEYSYRFPSAYIRGTARLARVFRESQLNLVHCSDLPAAYHAAVAAWLAGIPVLCHIQSHFPDEIRRRHTVPISAVDHFAFVSRAVWRNFDRIYKVPEDRGTVVYNWAPLAGAILQETSRARLREEFGIAETAPLLGMFARVAPPKDFETLISAMVHVTRSRPDVRLLMVGANNDPASEVYFRGLCDAIDRAGLTRSIVWTGFRRDVPDLMRAVDIVVLATRSEGFGLVLLEAMNLGRPVVASSVGGVPEIVDHGKNGLLHECGDAEGLGRAILSLIADPNLAAVVSEGGRRTALERFSEEGAVNNLQALYHKLAKSRSPRMAA
jgi:glycosyltransferase involved in cell wall biosynthesis